MSDRLSRIERWRLKKRWHRAVAAGGPVTVISCPTFNEGLMEAAGTTLVTVDRLAALVAVAEAASVWEEARSWRPGVGMAEPSKGLHEARADLLAALAALRADQ